MKVVYNDCYGGFTLSRKAILLGRDISGDKLWNGACIIGDNYDSGRSVDSDYGGLKDSISRHDDILVGVVEVLGEQASGFCSALAIKEIPDGSEYEITEYDGFESVEPPRMSW